MNSPVGVFDSGLGGLSVASHILRALPNERIVYFADNAHVPYGERPREEVQSFAVGICGFLIEKGAKAIVMACNMSSAVALDIARAQYPGIPIIGMIEPGARAAVNVSKGRPIGILATTGTVKSEAYKCEISKISPTSSVFQQACPKFVPLVESGRANSEEAEAAACTYVEPLLDCGCSTIVLGCTHYPFLIKAIKSAAGNDVAIIDPAEEVLLALKMLLDKKNAKSGALENPHEFYTSGVVDGFASIGSAFLGKQIGHVKSVAWGIDLGRTIKDAVV